MKIRCIFFALTGTVAFCLAPLDAPAQNNKAPTSYGLTVNVVRVIHKQNDLSVQLIIKNNNNVRVYLTDARTDDSQLAFLSSGEHLQYPFTSGLPFCNGSYSGCIANRYEMSIDKFSYIEPDSTLPMAMKYSVQQHFDPQDTISFSVTLIAAFAKSDVAPEDVGAFKRVTFPFREIPLPQE